jgi:hypothetical protein
MALENPPLALVSWDFADFLMPEGNPKKWQPSLVPLLSGAVCHGDFLLV